MYRMIIADDEIIVRESLVEAIPWKNLGVNVSASAANGQEAYELCKELKPDILLTDIRMPILDGLEVAMRLKDEGMKTKVLIISGISDFNYAKTALEVNAEGYILKPIKVNELEAAVTKVVNRLNIERTTEEKIRSMRQQIKENSILAREQFLRRLVKGAYKDENEILRKIDYFDIGLITDSLFLIGTCKIDQINDENWNSSEESRQLHVFSILNIINEILETHRIGFCFCTDESEFVIIFSQKERDVVLIQEVSEEILSFINKFLDTYVSICLGRYVNKFIQLYLSYKDASTAIQFRFYTGGGSILNIEDINKITDTNIGGQEKLDKKSLTDQMAYHIKIGDNQSVQALLGEIFNELPRLMTQSISYVKSFCIEFILVVIQAVSDAESSVSQVVPDYAIIIDRINKIATLPELESYLKSVLLPISKHFSDKYLQKNDRIIRKVREYIDVNYPEEISVVKIAGEVFMSPNYVGLIFRQETGESITEYLTRVRIEASKELLKNPELKVLDISERVGYINSQYFSTIFKKYTGLSPQQYRTLNA